MGAHVHGGSGIVIYLQVLELSLREMSCTARPGAAIRTRHPHGAGDSGGGGVVGCFETDYCP